MLGTVFTFLYFSSLLLSSGVEAKKLKVGVYYETLCPDSKRFIRSQLNYLMKNGGDEHIDVDFIPYGKASTIRDGSKISFTCQHGKPECDGNKMHACALKYLNLPKEQVSFVGCSMSASNPPSSLLKCSREVGVDEERLTQIQSCSMSSEGDELLAEYGDRTSALRPKLFFVPTITYDDVFDEDSMWKSQSNLKGVVCDKLNNEPEFCQPASRVRGNYYGYRGENRGERRVKRAYL